MASSKHTVCWMPFHLSFPCRMFHNRVYLIALIGLSVALLSSRAQAQAADSAASIKPLIVAAQANESSKPHTKPIRIICRSTLPAGNSPLYVVDGRPIQEQDLNSMNPNDIDKIEILKGNTAIAIYGSRGANGVVLMTMKHLHAKPLH